MPSWSGDVRFHGLDGVGFAGILLSFIEGMSKCKVYEIEFFMYTPSFIGCCNMLSMLLLCHAKLSRQ